MLHSTIADLFFLAPLFLCWGSFLNVVAYRLIQEQSIIEPRSFCPGCKHSIAWYDNIPVISWLLLRGKCRNCKESISFLYPFIEMLTTFVFSLLYAYIPLHYFFAYFIFFSALIITIRSDLETMLISRYATVFLAPLGILFSSLDLLPISWLESICGALFGYIFLFIINSVFKWWRNIDGIGEGDFDLLLFIGSFTGIIGCWTSITFGSILGSLYGITNLFFTQSDKASQVSLQAKLPFGPFLACGAIIFALMQKTVFLFF